MNSNLRWSPNPERLGRRGIVHIVVGVAVLTIGVWSLWRDLPPMSTTFYAFAWWGIIFIADGWCVLRRGSSLMTTRRRHVSFIMITSITFWVFFEMLNSQFFHNWYYVGVIPFDGPGSVLYAAAFMVLAFSTVFMGMFEIHDAVCAVGLFRNRRGRRRTFPRSVIIGVQIMGLMLAGLAVLRPYYLAPLIWGSFTFIVDPINYRKGARSILRDIENGEWGVIARLLIAGLVSGLVWEGANFLAPQKWIYTVRGLESFKLFEMPLLGFLGFPGLMLDAMAAYALFSWLVLGNRTWENPEDVRHEMPPRPVPSPWVFRLSVIPQAALWGVVGLFMAPIGSLALELEQLPLLTPPAISTLKEQGVYRPRHLLRESSQPAAAEALRRSLGYDRSQFQALRDQAELFSFKGIGGWYGPLLNELGIRRVEQLAGWDPEALFTELHEHAAAKGHRTPSRDMVRVWVLGARSRSIMQRA